MKPLVRAALAAVLLFASAAVLAQSAAVVEAIQMPAWVERAGARMPLAPGMLLQPGDVIRTGAGSRLVVRLAERSLVKLGENGELRFTELSPSKELFKAALHLLEGAFRFTTDVAVRQRRREVSITVANVTAGIRGTDLWGKYADSTETVCLIEGHAEVTAPNEAAVTLDQPRQFYRRIGGKTQPVGFIDPAMLDQWAKQTELQPGRPATRIDGRFTAILARADSQNAALEAYDRLRAAGYPAEIRPVREQGALVYLVRVRHLSTRADARALEAQLRGK